MKVYELEKGGEIPESVLKFDRNSIASKLDTNMTVVEKDNIVEIYLSNDDKRDGVFSLWKKVYFDKDIDIKGYPTVIYKYPYGTKNNEILNIINKVGENIVMNNEKNQNDMTAERYLLIGAYCDEDLLENAECVGICYGNREEMTYDYIQTYIWTDHKDDLNKFDILFLITEKYEVLARASSFTNMDFLRMSIENHGDLARYNPVYVDIAEHDERVLLSDILDVDYEEIKNIWLK